MKIVLSDSVFNAGVVDAAEVGAERALLEALLLETLKADGKLKDVPDLSGGLIPAHLKEFKKQVKRLKQGEALAPLEVQIDDEFLGKFARALQRASTDPDHAKWGDILRVAGRLGPTAAKLVRVKSKMPEGLRGKERVKAENRHYRDLLIDMVRDRVKPEDILAKLDEASNSKSFSRSVPTAIRKDISFDETGALIYKGDPLVARSGTPISLWVLRTAKVLLPKVRKTDDSYILGYIPANSAGGVQAVYKLSSVRKANKNKWEKVSKFSEILPKLKSKWLRLVTQGSGLGMLLQFAYLTSARIGNPGSAGLNKYGISTLLVRHATLKNGRVVVKYMGKGKSAGVPQTHIITRSPESVKLFNYLSERVEKAEPNAPLFLDERDGTNVSAAEANQWLKANSGGVVTVHKFRHVRATELAKEILADLKVPKGIDLNGAIDLFKKAMEGVGKVLGHYNLTGEEAKITPMTAIKNYISPEIGIAWFKSLGLEPPKTLFDTEEEE